jgi:hypothetical protein
MVGELLYSFLNYSLAGCIHLDSLCNKYYIYFYSYL